MASFFRPQHYYNVPEPNFQGLFRLIDDFDRYSGQSSNGRGRNGLGSFFTPKFDMTETETAYELHGELPGINKEDIHMEFTDPQTLQIRGKIERTRTEGNPPAGLLEGGDNNKSDKAITEHADDHSSHHVTVEDAPEEDGAATESNSSTPQDTPATTVAETAKPSAPAKQQESSPKHKYYLVERNVGSFSRSFNFPSRIDNESVKASLDNGILTVTVQKAKKHESRRIAIN
ncbi:hypothetical protein PFICI_00335 [Pestalotiopsis fici W106-1]|uniref:SHSP domain-containing protein n=1 Tax=Pestalotiopsis fici (strain W106-1 / CGMCC3.15140) TaxID=1229662 RepID=W3XLZ8_PESFW|nr:uncharacterized protein PFICI_00335 [Pestalotiopsis fici W106-1]ETS86507.1 hypothetical protein PFICI_00335 [Pestalotiopsis fici W106-1]